jgi:hypothetical protein
MIFPRFLVVIRWSQNLLHQAAILPAKLTPITLVPADVSQKNLAIAPVTDRHVSARVKIQLERRPPVSVSRTDKAVAAHKSTADLLGDLLIFDLLKC